ncbi:MAG: Hsp20 family protein [Chloroflexi bacterium]|nr:Hsp20 family protein [Chloroflexota bacterium]
MVRNRDTRIRDLRLRLGLSQEGFARLLGVSWQSVRRWESGLTRPLPIINLKLNELERKVQEQQKSGDTAMKGSKRDANVGVDVGLGGLFKGIGSLLDVVSRMEEAGKEQYSRSGEVDTAGGKMVYGFSVRMGLGGKPVIEKFGNIQDTEAGPVATEVREPMVDVLDEGQEFVIVAELPGVEEKDIRLGVKGDSLQLDASTRDRKYHREVLLPAPVDAKSLRSAYRNGVLEVRLAKP